MTLESWTSMRLGPDALKVLAHPLRSRLLTALRGGGPATATTLAGQLGTNTGATSYHLRRLASVALVEEVPGGKGRERWWQASTELHSWDDDAAGSDPDARAAAGWLRTHYLRHFVEHAESWLEHHDGWPAEWRRLAGSSDYLLELTVEQLDALLTELWDVVDRHHGAAIAANSGSAAENADALPADQRPHRLLLYVHDFPIGEYPNGVKS